ncbi:hypothetical protein [Marinobacterium aestuarii]|uniref:hypothetical protein n=1 Tax=Marinobacterium aestuarii TaxID=1821621 RepID=UPI0012FF8FBD|nr:hypothetical protein [Marinobacterium aestuarii]
MNAETRITTGVWRCWTGEFSRRAVLPQAGFLGRVSFAFSLAGSPCRVKRKVGRQKDNTRYPTSVIICLPASSFQLPASSFQLVLAPCLPTSVKNI